jgi:methylenetetrahydrofolate dehydrogenase (NADP+)/methenyltetrahydrofolate cyclohydrolase
MTVAATHSGHAHHDLPGRPVADEILAEVRVASASLAAAGLAPRLVSITIGDTAPVDVYVRNQKRTAERAGIAFAGLALAADISQAQAIAEIERLNTDPSVTGIILQRPLPAHLSVKALQSAIASAKDVEGMHPTSIGNIVYGNSAIGPCTALAAVEMLRRTGLGLEGLEVVVIGHSEIVGKPIAFLLMAEGATVTVCHHLTRSVAMHSRRADVVFVAVGRAHLIGPDMIKPGAVVIDIGINQVSGADGSPRVVGDVDMDAVRPVAGWLTPVPGGVGPVTVAMLMRNTVRAAQMQWAEGARDTPPRPLDHVRLRGLEISMLIGLHAWERTTPQTVMVDVAMACERRPWGDSPVVCYETAANRIVALAQSGHVDLVETLAEAIADQCLTDPRVRRVEVSVEKPGAVKGARAVGVTLTRSA